MSLISISQIGLLFDVAGVLVLWRQWTLSAKRENIADLPSLPEHDGVDNRPEVRAYRLETRRIKEFGHLGPALLIVGFALQFIGQ